MCIVFFMAATVPVEAVYAHHRESSVYAWLMYVYGHVYTAQVDHDCVCECVSMLTCEDALSAGEGL